MIERALTDSVYSGNDMGQHYKDPAHPVVRRAVRLVEETGAKSGLDVACGRGLVSLTLAQETDIRTITAIDINREGVTELTRTAKKERLPIKGVVFDAASEEGYSSIVPDPVDVVVAKDVYPFLEPMQGALLLENIHNALHLGGWVILTAPSTRSQLFHESEQTDELLYRKIEKPAQDYIQTTRDHFLFTTIEDMAGKMEDTGIEMVEANHFGRAKGWIMAVGQKV